MVAETVLKVEDLVMPLFVKDIEGNEPIGSMPGIFKFGPAALLAEVESCLALGIKSFILFPAIAEKFKTADALEALNPQGLYYHAIASLKKAFPQICLISDIALDPYSSDGHDGLVQDGKILNDATVELLSKMAVLQADAGIDIVGPSDMMDCRVAAIRDALDKAGHTQVGIMSYTAKYASAFYGPFREALDSAPKAGDKKTYQMNPANSMEALIELAQDEAEGADMVMVKPAGAYLDVIRAVRESTLLPLAAYQVSGEYAQIHAASRLGWLDYASTRDESLLAIKRAGADMILTYFAAEVATLLA
jgi:porphobilinogen synthase